MERTIESVPRGVKHRQNAAKHPRPIVHFHRHAECFVTRFRELVVGLLNDFSELVDILAFPLVCGVVCGAVGRVQHLVNCAKRWFGLS
jgi:hypothetical protein